MDVITIEDLGVLCRIGVPDEERAKPQRLLITVALEGDFSKACASDDLAQTINYYEVSRRIDELCREKSFKLIERLASEIASMALAEFGPEQVRVRIKKFILPGTRWVAFELARSR